MLDEIKEYHLIGKITGRNIKDLSISISFNRYRADNIKGKIYGTYKRSKELKRLFGKPFEIIGQTKDGKEIKINSCLLEKVNMLGINENFIAQIALFSAENVEISVTRNLEVLKRECVKIELHYFIQGGKWFFPFSIETSSYTGDVKCEFKPFTFNINSEVYEFTKIYMHESLKNKQVNMRCSYSRPAIVIKKEGFFYDGLEEFLKNIELKIHDVLVFMSLLSRQRVTWSEYQLIIQSTQSDAVEVVEFIHTIFPKRHDDDFKLYLIHPNFNEIFPKYFLNYLKLKDKFGLELITYGLEVSHEEGGYVGQKFLTLCTALETLKDSFSKHRKIQYIIEKNKFKEITKKIKELIKNLTNDEKSQLVEKLSGINSPSFRIILKALFDEYNIQTDDLLLLGETTKDKDIFYFLTLRNKLVHSGKVSNDTELIEWGAIIRLILERALLRIIGWDQPSNADSPIPHLLYL